ncbi:hypothetical protein PSQ19_06125 [Devosia algicola]|uniref:Methyltransferase n=1 Tax=Devosia algicola TaxID=3026418 RepID=A0ABY7YRY4_9HYPH|nr:hypothetical protein [Devosia algicola]WDR03645.1 hypothetical protein PSQ19_06125 [Devosia algicola]
MTQTASKYDRLDLEKYFTPAWPTEALLSAESFVGGIFDPAAGDGGILNALPASMKRHGSDISPDADGITAIDFFDIKAGSWPNIVTNPPYGPGGRLAVRFIEHALELTKPMGGKVAMLLRVDFDSAKTRRHIFADHLAYAAKYVLTRRIRWTNFEQKEAGPTVNHAWLVWDWRKRAGSPVTLGYLPTPELEQSVA